jgi:pyruvate-formate lyase-activating enzyme
MYRSAIAHPGIKLRWATDNTPISFSGMRKGQIAEVYLPGCNLKCEFCIAPYLSNLGEVRGFRWVEPSDLVNSIHGLVDILGMSGGEPSIHVEYLADVFSRCHDQGIRTVMESNGYMSRSTAEKLAKYTDYVGLGLKASLDTAYYRRKLGISDPQPIREAAKVFAENGCEIMFTDLTDPNLWDDSEAFMELTKWISREIGTQVPLALAPMERVGIPPPWTDERVYITPHEQRSSFVAKYLQIAKESGLGRAFLQTNARRNSEERHQELEKIGLYRTLEKLGISPSAQRWG